MAKRISAANGGVVTALPKRGLRIPMDPTAGATEQFDAGTILDVSVGRALAEAYYLDGTAGARIRVALGTAGAIGTGDFTFIVPHTVPATVQNNPIAMLIGDSEPYLYTSNGQGFRYDNTNNRLVWAAHSATGQLDRRYTNFQTSNAGKSSFLVARRTAGILEVFWEGQLLTPNSTDQSGTSPPADFAGGLRSQLACIVGYGYTGTATLRQRCGPPILINAALSNAEITAHAITGLLPTWCELGTGNAVGRVTGDSNTFAAGVGAWTNGGSASVLTADTVNNELDVTTPHQFAGCFLPSSAFSGLRVGHRYRFTITFSDVPAGANISVALSGTSVQLATDVGNGTYVVDFDYNSTGLTGVFIGRNGLTGAGFTIKNPQFTALGPIFQLVPDPNFALRDVKANQLHATRTTGTNYLGNRVDSSTAWTVVHSGSGNLQFGGGTAIDTTEGWVIDSLIVRSTAAVTWSLGNVSAGAQHVSAYSLAVGDNYIPAASIVARNLSTANLWSNSNGAATITIYPVLRRTF